MVRGPARGSGGDYSASIPKRHRGRGLAQQDRRQLFDAGVSGDRGLKRAVDKGTRAGASPTVPVSEDKQAATGLLSPRVPGACTAAGEKTSNLIRCIVFFSSRCSLVRVQERRGVYDPNHSGGSPSPRRRIEPPDE